MLMVTPYVLPFHLMGKAWDGYWRSWSVVWRWFGMGANMNKQRTYLSQEIYDADVGFTISPGWVQLLLVGTSFIELPPKYGLSKYFGGS